MLHLLIPFSRQPQTKKSKDCMMANTIFITGATGNIGGKLVTRILKDDAPVQLIPLVRASSNIEAQRRVENVIRVLSPEIDLVQARKKIRVICGDITLNELGLTDSLYNRLAKEVTHIIHAAATTKFQLPLECARLINYGGTKNVMAFAKLAQETGKLQRIAYISTAYVCGRKEGTIYEDEFDRPQGFSNTYEKTKWESEAFVRSLISGLPLVIFRPSIVIGDSQSGRTITFNVLYTPLRWIKQGMLTALPCSPGIPLDVVPADFVSNAIHNIFMKTKKCIGKTYHIVAGSKGSTTVGEIVRRALDFFNSKPEGRPLDQIKFLPLYSGTGTTLLPSQAKRGLQLLKSYEPYICLARCFDNKNTIEALQGTGITAPVIPTYFHNILEYSFATDWRRQIKYAA
jgi:thioester reductase-like protein